MGIAPCPAGRGHPCAIRADPTMGGGALLDPGARYGGRWLDATRMQHVPPKPLISKGTPLTLTSLILVRIQVPQPLI